MQFLKLSLIFIISVNIALANAKFSSKECLESSFETIIKSKGKFFGLIKNDLKVKKNKCLIEIRHKGILESIWNIDICREPIHMKVTSKGSQNVFKKANECNSESTDDFCYYLNELKVNIDDYGLIFAKGLKENLKDPHGQIYCTSLLINKYFDENIVFSLFEKTVDLYSEKTETCELPKVEKTTTPKVENEIIKAPVDTPVVEKEIKEERKKF